jgi:uncharacterized membrane protein
MPLSNRFHAAALALHVILMLGLIAWTTSLPGLGLTLVLLAPLRGLVRGAPYTFAWASMLLSVYCAFLLGEGYAHPFLKGWAFSLASIAALEFVALVMFVRLRSREMRSASP